MIEKYDFIFGHKTELLGNFREIQKIINLSEKINIMYSKSTIVMLSLLIISKRLDIAIKAFAIVIGKNYDWNLKIIDDGHELDSLKSLSNKLGVSNNVTIYGEFLLNPFPYIRSASMFLFSSELEGFGGVLVEALALSCSILSTDCQVGPREILDNYNYGLLIPVNDEERMDDAIIQLMKDNKLRDGFIIKSLSRAKDYDARSVIQRFKYIL